MTHDCYCCIYADDEGVCERGSCYLLEDEDKPKDENN